MVTICRVMVHYHIHNEDVKTSFVRPPMLVFRQALINLCGIRHLYSCRIDYLTLILALTAWTRGAQLTDNIQNLLKKICNNSLTWYCEPDVIRLDWIGWKWCCHSKLAWLAYYLSKYNSNSRSKITYSKKRRQYKGRVICVLTRVLRHS